MTDFMKFTLNHLLIALLAAGAAALLSGLLLKPCRAWYLKRYPGNRFPMGKLLIGVLLVFYLLVLAWVTILGREASYGGKINLHWFRAVRSAWNLTATYTWLNIFINIAMFMPLGGAAVLLHRNLRNWLAPLLAGLILSGIIETVQYFTGKGFLDVDDLWCNTLGAFLGGCCVLALLSMKNKQWGRAAGNFLPVFLTAAIVAGFFLSYWLQPYGNLPSAPDHRQKPESVVWTGAEALSEQPLNAMIYQAPAFTKETGEQFAEAFGKRHNLDLSSKNYYDGSAVYYDPGENYYLFLLYRDGSYLYQGKGFQKSASGSLTGQQFMDILEAYEIAAPDGAEFSEGENGNYYMAARQLKIQGGMYDGAVRCRVDAHGNVLELEQYLNFFEVYREEALLSPARAFEKLQRGEFAGLYNPALDYEITGWSLSYRADTKGFYRPVYIFDALADGEWISGGLLVTAM